MTHDPLCPSQIKQARFVSETVAGFPQPNRVTLENGPCQCSLIAKVRADTLDKARQAVEDVPWGISYGKGLHINQSKALDAIDALRTT